MTDFYSVLQRAVASLPDGSGPQRRAVYDKARKALLKQLQSFDPPLPSSDVTAQRLALEDAIRKIENEIARQIRTRRAVQGALPAGRSGQPATAREGEAEREARRRAEEARAREQQAELLESAVSQATIASEAAPEPSQQTALVPAQPVAVPAPVDDMHDADAVMFEEELDEDEVPHTRGRRHDAVFDEDEEDDYDDEDVVDAETYEDDDVVAARPDRVSERERRREEARALRAERRAERKSRGRGKAKPEKARKKPRKDKAERKGEKGRRSTLSRMVLPVIVLALLAGASYAAFTQREKLMAVIDSFESQGGPSSGGTRAPIAAETDPVVTKNSDRLPSTLDGEDTRTVTTTAWPPRAEGEGDADPEATTNAARTVGNDVSPFTTDGGSTPATEQAEEQVAAADPAATAATGTAQEPAPARPPIADISGGGSQQAVLYEEAARAGEQGTAVAGAVEWSMVRQSVGGGDPEPVVRANAEIPDRGISATLTIRENRDGALPASHLIEIAFDLPDSFEGGGVKNVPGVIMKETEQSRGDALRGAAARVSSGLFWIALSEDEADRETNLRLLRERDWIDIPILYESGRRAILTLRKGSDGYKSVDAAIQAWSPG
ncbi:hypothetical protein [Acuticoccus mangrovi]|uniref:CheA signal transduction histidine kinase n=1 Tax=Acuticoccus mangrovi TaxID=2796142 RepID=A0A934IPI7_9HYPH|nr:hypothetical protein [Acuticoccus mangrovi]MBJ3776213.1 hypothetical protein [Acuticoccus mangrovi]